VEIPCCGAVDFHGVRLESFPPVYDHPVELWKAIKRDWRASEVPRLVKRHLYEVKLKDHGSIKAYAMQI
jgi:hypothetical protein